MEINLFEGNRLEWLVHKRIICFWQKAGLWEGERESTYWCMPATLSFSNIPISYLFFFLLFFSILVFYSPVFQVPILWCWCCPLYTARASFYSACCDQVLLFYPLTTFVWSRCTCRPPLVHMCVTPHH